jgi:hypothetical protein
MSLLAPTQELTCEFVAFWTKVGIALKVMVRFCWMFCDRLLVLNNPPGTVPLPGI